MPSRARVAPPPTPDSVLHTNRRCSTPSSRRPTEQRESPRRRLRCRCPPHSFDSTGSRTSTTFLGSGKTLAWICARLKAASQKPGCSSRAAWYQSIAADKITMRTARLALVEEGLGVGHPKGREGSHHQPRPRGQRLRTRLRVFRTAGRTAAHRNHLLQATTAEAAKMMRTGASGIRKRALMKNGITVAEYTTTKINNRDFGWR